MTFRAVSVEEQRAARLRVAYRRYLGRRGIPRAQTLDMDLGQLRAIARAVGRKRKDRQ